jgi:uncharacterized repeat protein (TIGR01451 family)
MTSLTWRTLACLWLLLVPVVGLAGEPEDPILFESSAPGVAGGGLGVSANYFPGHTFRLTERAHISAVGAQLKSFTATSVFAGLYRIGTPVSPADVVNDSNLVAVTLLDVPAGGSVSEVSGAMDVDLEPGWYALMIGQGRHGATATGLAVTLVPTGNPKPPQSWGPYSVNTTTGNLVLQQTSTRLFVRGQLLPPEPPPAGQFVLETARPAAWWGSGTFNLNGNIFLGQRFTLNRYTRIDRVNTWLYLPSEPIFVAIFPLAGPNLFPPLPTNPNFEDLALGSALTTTGPHPEDYAADFGGLTLAPGSYAVVFGKGKFGATGEGGVITVSDEIVTPGSLFMDLAQSPGWFQQTSYSLSVRLTGIEPDLVAESAAIDFGGVPIGAVATREVTLLNLREEGALTISALQLAGAAAARYTLVDADACAVIPADGECTFTVEYRPVAVGIDDATVEVSSDGAPDPYLVPVTGSGLASAVVTPLSAANGSIEPAEPQIVALGTSLEFSLVADPGYHAEDVAGTCDGTLAGQTYTIDPVTTDCSLEPVFALNPATTLSVLAGTPQSTEVASAFGNALVVQATNEAGLAVPGTSVLFNAPLTGASASVPTSAIADSEGQVEVAAIANTIAGSYQVTASVAGITTPAVFELINLAGPAQQIQLSTGDEQIALVGNAFPLPLGVRISDEYSNPVNGVEVSFDAPDSGASATLTAGTATSGSNGIAAVGASANAIVGSYQVTATASGLGSVPFALTNRAPVLALSVAIEDGIDYVRYGETIDYLVTIANAGSDAAIGVSLQVPLPPQLDADATLWTCLDLDSGCIEEGSGALQDADVLVGAGASVRWLLSAPVRADAPGDGVDLQATSDATYHPSVSTSDQNWLVLFRDGFESLVPGAVNGTDTGTDEDAGIAGD